MALPVDGLLLELSNANEGLLEALADLPPEKNLGAGVIDVLTPEIESVAVVGQRVERLLQSVPADRLWLTPDAGLRTLDTASAKAKLESMIQAAT